MSERFSKLLPLAGLGAFLLIWSQAAGAQTIVREDDTFSDFTWITSGVELSHGAVDSEHVTAGGSLGSAMLQITHELGYPLPQSYARATSVHIYGVYTYSPFESGPLQYVDSGYGLQGVSAGIIDFPSRGNLAVQQDGRVFRTNDRWPNLGNFWVAVEPGIAFAEEFWAVDRSCDRPDFSAGGADMQFGIALTSAQTHKHWPLPVFQDATVILGVDDWYLELEPGVLPENPANDAPDAVIDFMTIDGFRQSGTMDVLANDSDPNGDSLFLLTSSPAEFGHTWVQQVPGTLQRVVFYQHLGGLISDSFCYAVRDVRDVTAAPKYATGTVEVTVDCGCAAGCAVDLFADKADSLDVALMYRVRDEILNDGIAGRRFIDYYYHSQPELLYLLVTGAPALGAEAVSVAELVSPLLVDYLDGPGDMLVTQQQVDALNIFLGNLHAGANPELQQIITDEMINLGNLQDYVGMTSRQAFIQALVIDGIFDDSFEEPPVAPKNRATAG